MATYVLTNEENLSSIANAIRTKNGDETATYTPSEMAPAILSLSGGDTPDNVVLWSTDETAEFGDISTPATSVKMDNGKTLEAALGGCWIEFTDEDGNPTDEPYIHWLEEVSE